MDVLCLCSSESGEAAPTTHYGLVGEKKMIVRQKWIALPSLYTVAFVIRHDIYMSQHYSNV